MYHHYKTVYKVSAQFQAKDKSIPIFFTIDEMFHLFDTTQGGYDGWHTKDKTVKSVLLQPDKWGNICLMGNPKNETLQTLIGAGAEIIEKSLVYEDAIDAGIQVAYMAAKADIKVKHIVEATNDILTEQGYIKLQELFYEDFPEKFI